MEFLFTHLQPGAVVPFYCDTDSIFLGLTNCNPRSDDMTTEEKLRNFIFESSKKNQNDSDDSDLRAMTATKIH